jgi:hypothetical protein
MYHKCLKSSKFKVPNNPYKIEKPKSKRADENDPNTKYFKPASTENDEFFLKAAIT